MSGVVQESNGHGLEQPDLIRTVLNRKVDKRSPEVPFNLSYDFMIKFLICTNLNHFDADQSVSTSTAFQADTVSRNVFIVSVCNQHKYFCPI